jgi:hypothetical protein
MADFIVKTLPPRNIITRGLNSSSKGSRAGSSKTGKGSKGRQSTQRQPSSAAAAAAAEEDASRLSPFPAAEASAGTPLAFGTAAEEQQQLDPQNCVEMQQQQQQRQRQLDQYGFHWRSNPSSQQLVVLGELPVAWQQQQQQQGQQLLPLQEQPGSAQKRQRPKRQKFKSLKTLYAGDQLFFWWRVAEPAALQRAQQAALEDLAPIADSAAAAAAAAAGAGDSADCVESDEEFYQAAAAAGLGSNAYTLQHAPVRRFYQVGFLEPDSEPWAVLEPCALATRRGLPQLLRYVQGMLLPCCC